MLKFLTRQKFISRKASFSNASSPSEKKDSTLVTLSSSIPRLLINHLTPGHAHLQVYIPRTHDEVTEWFHRHLIEENEEVVGFDVEWRPSLKRGAPQNRISLVQISTVKSCMLIQLKHLRIDSKSKSTIPSVPTALADILNSSRFLKVGVGIKEDLDRLRKDWNVNHDGKFIDVGLVGKRLYRERKPLQVLPSSGIESAIPVPVTGSPNGDTDHTSSSSSTPPPSSPSPTPVTRSSGNPGFGLASLANHFLNVKINKSSSVQCSDWESVTLRPRQIEYASYDALLGRLLYEHFVAEGAFRDKREIVLSLIEQSTVSLDATTTHNQKLKMDSLTSFGRGEARRALSSAQEDNALSNLLGERIQEHDENSLKFRLSSSSPDAMDSAGPQGSQDVDMGTKNDSWRQSLSNYLSRLGLGYKIVVTLGDESNQAREGEESTLKSPRVYARIVALDGTIEGNTIAIGVGRNKKIAAESACRDALIDLIRIARDELRRVNKDEKGEGGKQLISLYAGRGSRNHPLFVHLVGKATNF